jgi:hypothetical protein
MRRLLATFAFASLAACSGLGGELDQRVDGTWVGTSNGVSISMSLIETGNVTGIATMSGGTVGSRSYAVTGAYKPPTLSATLSGSAPGDTITMAATVSGKSIVGTLSGGGFAGNAVALQRQ